MSRRAATIGRSPQLNSIEVVETPLVVLDVRVRVVILEAIVQQERVRDEPLSFLRAIARTAVSPSGGTSRA